MKTRTGTAEHYTWGDHCDGWILVDRPELSVIQERMPPGTSEIRHYHERSRQFFYVLSGSLVIEVDGEKVVLGPQEGVEVAALVPHQVFNQSGDAAEFLVTSQPRSRGDRILSPV